MQGLGFKGSSAQELYRVQGFMPLRFGVLGFRVQEYIPEPCSIGAVFGLSSVFFVLRL